MIRTRGLTKRFGKITAVSDLDLDVVEGDIYGFLGPNGSGKTTTVRMLLGLVLATSGSAELLGQSMPKAAGQVLPQVGSMIEGPAAYPRLSGRANLKLFDAMARDSGLRGRKQRVGAALERVGLAGVDSRPVRAYSLGMRQRLGLANALLRSPRLLVLDEPTNGLDPQGIHDIRDLLLELNRAGTTIFVSSHLLVEIEQMCTRVGVIDRGRLVLQEQLNSLRGPTGLVRVRTPDVALVLESYAAHGAVPDPGSPHQVLIPGTDPAGLNVQLVRAGIRVEELTVERHTLEQTVLAATGAGSDDLSVGSAGKSTGESTGASAAHAETLEVGR